jgi:hypothetical protein
MPGSSHSRPRSGGSVSTPAPYIGPTPVQSYLFYAGVVYIVADTREAVDAAAPVDAQNAPTGPWKTADGFPQAPTAIIGWLLWERLKEAGYNDAFKCSA